MNDVLIAVKGFEARFPQAMRLLEEHGVRAVVRDSVAGMTPEEKERLLYPARALFVAAEPCGAAFLAQLPGLKLLSRMGSGMDNIDLAYCKARGIAVTNSRGCNANAVAELALLLILASLRELRDMFDAARAGDWSRRRAGEELYGKTVGLVGFGMIAQKLAALLAPFHVGIIACDPFMNQAAAANLHVEAVPFEEVISRSDVLSVHIPATPENVGLFDQSVFEAMKDGAVFINCSRGVLVSEDALLKALQTGKLYAAASDVWAVEPVAPNHPLFSQPNFIGTPHIGGMTAKSAIEDSLTVAESIVSFFEGKEIPHRIV